MPYSNISFVKLFVDLLDSDDRFLYQLNESQQLLYVKMLLLAGKTGNRISKRINYICNAINYSHEAECFQSDISRIMEIFPKLKQAENWYYFEKFEELHNYISKENRKSRINQKEAQRKSKGNPEELQRNAKGSYQIKNKNKKKKKNNTLTPTPKVNSTAQKDCAEPATGKTLSFPETQALAPNQAVVASIAEVYKKQTGLDFKTGREDFILAADLIKKHGMEAVGVKCLLLAQLCASRSAWFTRDGWADFSLKKLSAQWNAIIPGTGATKEQIDEAKAMAKVEAHNEYRRKILQQ